MWGVDEVCVKFNFVHDFRCVILNFEFSNTEVNPQ